jgi:hypothetical protein
MTQRRTIPALLAAATFGLGATAAWAEQPSQQQQIEQLQQQIKELQAQRVTAPAYTAKDVDATVDSVLHDANRRSQMLAETGGFYGGWMDDHFVIRSADGNYDISPGIQFQFRTVTNFNENGKSNGDDNVDNGFETRRLKLSFDGHAITKNLYYNFVWSTDRKSGNLINEEAYAVYKFADNFSVKLGQYKEYIYHEQTVSSKRQLAVDRSLLNEHLNGGESYVQGVDLLWDTGGALRADVGFTDGYNSRNTNFEDPPTNAFDFGVHARVEYAVMGGFKGYNQFTSMGNKADLLVIGAGADWSQNGDINVIHHNADVQWNTGPLAIYAAYVGVYTDFGNSLGGGGNGDNYDYGFVVQAGYLVNPEWELFARYDWMHLDNRAAGMEDDFHEVALGVNYYMHGHNAKVTVDVGWLPNGSPSDQDGIGVFANNGDNEYFIRGQFQLLL